MAFPSHHHQSSPPFANIPTHSTRVPKRRTTAPTYQFTTQHVTYPPIKPPIPQRDATNLTFRPAKKLFFQSFFLTFFVFLFVFTFTIPKASSEIILTTANAFTPKRGGLISISIKSTQDGLKYGQVVSLSLQNPSENIQFPKPGFSDLPDNFGNKFETQQTNPDQNNSAFPLFLSNHPAAPSTCFYIPNGEYFPTANDKPHIPVALISHISNTKIDIVIMTKLEATIPVYDPDYKNDFKNDDDDDDDDDYHDGSGSGQQNTAPILYYETSQIHCPFRIHPYSDVTTPTTISPYGVLISPPKHVDFNSLLALKGRFVDTTMTSHWSSTQSDPSYVHIHYTAAVPTDMYIPLNILMLNYTNNPYLFSELSSSILSSMVLSEPQCGDGVRIGFDPNQALGSPYTAQFFILTERPRVGGVCKIFLPSTSILYYTHILGIRIHAHESPTPPSGFNYQEYLSNPIIFYFTTHLLPPLPSSPLPQPLNVIFVLPPQQLPKFLCNGWYWSPQTPISRAGIGMMIFSLISKPDSLLQLTGIMGASFSETLKSLQGIYLHFDILNMLDDLLYGNVDLDGASFNTPELPSLFDSQWEGDGIYNDGLPFRGSEIEKVFPGQKLNNPLNHHQSQQFMHLLLSTPQYQQYYQINSQYYQNTPKFTPLGEINSIQPLNTPYIFSIQGIYPSIPSTMFSNNAKDDISGLKFKEVKIPSYIKQVLELIRLRCEQELTLIHRYRQVSIQALEGDKKTGKNKEEVGFMVSNMHILTHFDTVLPQLPQISTNPLSDEYQGNYHNLDILVQKNSNNFQHNFPKLSSTFVKNPFPTFLPPSSHRSQSIPSDPTRHDLYSDLISHREGNNIEVKENINNVIPTLSLNNTANTANTANTPNQPPNHSTPSNPNLSTLSTSPHPSQEPTVEKSLFSILLDRIDDILSRLMYFSANVRSVVLTMLPDKGFLAITLVHPSVNNITIPIELKYRYEGADGVVSIQPSVSFVPEQSKITKITPNLIDFSLTFKLENIELFNWTRVNGTSVNVEIGVKFDWSHELRPMISPYPVCDLWVQYPHVDELLYDFPKRQLKQSIVRLGSVDFDVYSNFMLIISGKTGIHEKFLLKCTQEIESGIFLPDLAKENVSIFATIFHKHVAINPHAFTRQVRLDFNDVQTLAEFNGVIQPRSGGFSNANLNLAKEVETVKLGQKNEVRFEILKNIQHIDEGNQFFSQSDQFHYFPINNPQNYFNSTQNNPNIILNMIDGTILSPSYDSNPFNSLKLPGDDNSSMIPVKYGEMYVSKNGQRFSFIEPRKPQISQTFKHSPNVSPKNSPQSSTNSKPRLEIQSQLTPTRSTFSPQTEILGTVPTLISPVNIIAMCPTISTTTHLTTQIIPSIISQLRSLVSMNPSEPNPYLNITPDQLYFQVGEHYFWGVPDSNQLMNSLKIDAKQNPLFSLAGTSSLFFFGVVPSFFPSQSSLLVGSSSHIIPWSSINYGVRRCHVTITPHQKVIIFKQFFSNPDNGQNNPNSPTPSPLPQLSLIPSLKFFGGDCFSSYHCPSNSVCYKKTCLPLEIKYKSGEFPKKYEFTFETLDYFPAFTYSDPTARGMRANSQRLYGWVVLGMVCCGIVGLFVL
jgi:hypothetical protein